MVVEKLIEESGIIEIPRTRFILNRFQRLPWTTFYNYTHIYWYDGVKFYIGSDYLNRVDSMVEAGTLTYAVQTVDNKKSVKTIIAEFKNKLRNCNSTIHQVIGRYGLRNLELETWKINLLI